MKSVILSTILILIYIYLANNFFIPEVDGYNMRMADTLTANKIIKEIELLLIELPELKNKEAINSFIIDKFRRSIPEQYELVEVEDVRLNNDNYERKYNLLLCYDSLNIYDSIVIEDIYNTNLDKETIYPRISNVFKDYSRFFYEEYYFGKYTIYYWKIMLSLYFLLIVINFIMYFKKKNISFLKSNIVFLISVILLNTLYFGFIQRYNIYFENEQYFRNTGIVSAKQMFNFLSINSHLYATVSDVTLISISLFIVTFLLLRKKLK